MRIQAGFALLMLAVLPVSAADHTLETAHFSLWTDGQLGRAIDMSGRLQGAQMATLCQRALLLPYEAELRSRLSGLIGREIPETVRFSSAAIDRFRHQASGQQAECSGRVKPSDPQGDLQETALRALWILQPDPESTEFDQLLEILADRSDMDNDVLVYIASLMTNVEARALLFHLETETLKTSRSRHAAAQILSRPMPSSIQ